MSEGNASGQIDGTTALSQAKALGYPQGLPITFSDDTSGTSLTDIYDYLTGVKTGLSGYYRIGYYGPRTKLDSVLTSGHAVFGWQPTAWAGKDAEGKVIVSQLAHLFQYFGGAPISGTDLNKVLREPPFDWYAGGDMALTDADATLVANKVWDRLIRNAVLPKNPDGSSQESQADAFITDIHRTVYKLQTAVAAVPTVDEIVAAVQAAGAAGGLTVQQVEDAVVSALTKTPLAPTPPAP